MGLSVYLDTNIFVHAFEETPDRDPAIASLLVRLISGDCTEPKPLLLTSELTFGELWTGAYRDDNLELIGLYDSFLSNQQLIMKAPVSIEIIRSAAILRGNKPSLKTPDALHIATAALLECTYFLTSDRRIGQAGQNLMALKSTQSIPLTLIRPDLETLNKLVNGELST